MKKEWRDIISKELGCEPVLINSNLFSAQNRERLYWTNIPFDKNIQDKKIIDKHNTIYNKIYNIPPRIENDIIDEPKNVFKNKTCYAGVDILTIDNLGNVFRGWCQEGGVIGNVYNMPVDWPKDPIICKKEICNNGFDLLARKE